MFNAVARWWWCSEKLLHQMSSGSRRSSFCRLLNVPTSHDIAGNLSSSRQCTLSQSEGPSFNQWSNRSEETAEQTAEPMSSLDPSTCKVRQRSADLPRVVVVVIHLNSPELRRRKWSVTVTFPRSNGTGRPVSSLISVSTVPKSRRITGMYWTWSNRVVTISPFRPVIGTILSSGTILSPTMRGSAKLE